MQPPFAPLMHATTVEYHTAGEPFRIVLDGTPPIGGTTVAERRMNAIASPEVGALRALLCNEPRGHADMYGGFLVEPDDDGADLGVLFWHKDGFSTACGHGTIALGVWAIESGRVAAPDDGETEVVIDVPSGRVSALVRTAGGRVTDATFRNVPSWVIARGIEVATSRGTVVADLSYSGAIYASVDVAQFGLAVTPEHVGAIIELGREIKWLLDDRPEAQHPSDPRLSGVYGTIMFQDLGDTAHGPHQANATVFADGELDRSPCGSGTGARVALLADSGRLAADQTLTHDSIVGTRFHAAWAPGPLGPNERQTVVPSVRGRAHLTGTSSFVLDPADTLATGFVLR